MQAAIELPQLAQSASCGERYDQFSQGDPKNALSNWTDDFTAK
jgi:hypothetical protein